MFKYKKSNYKKFNNGLEPKLVMENKGFTNTLYTIKAHYEHS